jgi:hypothetical protein
MTAKNAASPNSRALFNGALTDKGLSSPACYLLSSVGTREYSASKDTTSLTPGAEKAAAVEKADVSGIIGGVVAALFLIGDSRYRCSDRAQAAQAAQAAASRSERRRLRGEPKTRSPTMLKTTPPCSSVIPCVVRR